MPNEFQGRLNLYAAQRLARRKTNFQIGHASARDLLAAHRSNHHRRVHEQFARLFFEEGKEIVERRTCGAGRLHGPSNTRAQWPDAGVCGVAWRSGAIVYE